MEGIAGEEASKILIFGGTGYLGKYFVKASIKLGHKTFVYTRPMTSQSNPDKINLLKEFESLDVTTIQGELDEHDKIVETLRLVDVVISVLPLPRVPDQIHIIEAIKVAGNIKRFIPSEFGVEEDRLSFLPPFEACLDKKRKVRRAVEAAGIPYTYISANCCGVYFINYLLRPHEEHDELIVYGSGEAKTLLIYEKDIAEYTIKVANDPRTCNRVVIYQMPKNILSQLELISLWEKKTGKSFKRIHVPEEELVKQSETSPFPDNVRASIIYSLFAKGDFLNYELGENDLEATSLYPDHMYTNIDQLLDVFLEKMVQAQASMPSTSAQDNLPRESQIDGSQVSRIQGGIDQTDKFSTSSKNEWSRKNMPDRIQVSCPQAEVGQGKHDNLLRQTENPESPGVLYSELDTGNGFPIKATDGEVERNTITTTEEH